jgi:hypothetical protein
MGALPLCVKSDQSRRSYRDGRQGGRQRKQFEPIAKDGRLRTVGVDSRFQNDLAEFSSLPGQQALIRTIKGGLAGHLCGFALLVYFNVWSLESQGDCGPKSLAPKGAAWNEFLGLNG